MSAPPIEIFQALADPVRLAMVTRLAAGPATVGELGAGHPISKPAVTKHVAVLDRVGLVHKRRQGKQIICSLRQAPLRSAESWLHDRQSFWTATLDRLDTHLDPEDPT